MREEAGRKGSAPFAPLFAFPLQVMQPEFISRSGFCPALQPCRAVFYRRILSGVRSPGPLRSQPFHAILSIFFICFIRIILSRFG